ncbi:cell division protease FtsH [Bradyrhizobium sp. S3.12.5]|uniref:AAA family ATPase n=1 Tax=Bradyrhizobium sp. S3.12.5 TaxID=3156386 RepID=UPI0033912E3F
MSKQKEDGGMPPGSNVNGARRSGKRGFAALVRAPAAQEPRSTDDWDIAGEDSDSVVAPPEEAENYAPRERLEPVRCIVDAALDAALSDDVRTRLSGPEAVAVVIRVPAAAWVAPVETAIERLNPRARVFARDGSNKSGHKSDVGNGEVAGHLARGRTVVGIAPSIAMLPRALVAAADLTVELKIASDIVGRAIARFTEVATAPEGIEKLGHLDLHDIVSAFRGGSKPAEIVERLDRTALRLSSPRTDRLPLLADAIEYGRARDWGLALGKDFSEYQKNSGLAFRDIGANALFAGAPGLGKTYYCRILCAHLGIPLIATSIAETFATSAGYLDSVIKAVRDTFAKAEASAPCAILWDEIDALPSRATLGRNSNLSSWWTPVVAEFLTLLDSAAGGDRPGVFVWGATNYPDRVDPALIRPGRLDRVIHFAEPGPDGIVSIARHHLAGELAGVDLAPIGQLGLGCSPAEIAGAVKTARSAARAAKRAIAYDDLVEALAPRVDLDARTLRRIAEHEAGHAVTAIALSVDDVVAVDIGGDRGALGRTVMRQHTLIETRATIESRVVAQLGGRAAEVVIYDGDCSANAGGGESSDLARSTEAVAALRVSMGLGDGLAYLGDPASAMQALRFDPKLKAAVDRDLATLHARAVEIVRRHRKALDAIATALVERRHLSGDEVRRIFAKHSP